MKNKIFYVLASALVLFSCSKEKSPAPALDTPMRFAVTVEGTTKASVTSADLKQFYLKVTGPNNAFSYFESIVKDDQGNWKASQPILWKDEESAITYAAASYGALGKEYFNATVTDDLFVNGASMGLLTNQSTQARLLAADLLTMASTPLTFAASNKGLVPITLKHGLAKLNIKLTLAPEYKENGIGLEANPIVDLAIIGMHTTFSFKPLTGEVTIPLGAPKGSVIPFMSAYDTAASVATYEAVLAPETLPAGALSLYFTVNGKDFQWTNSEALALAQGGEYTVPVSIDYNTVPSGPVTPDPGPSPDPSPLSGVFSVGESSTVNFSPGNLRATYNGSSWIWGFAEHQWDYIGNAAGNTSINGNGTVSANGTVDLFGWVGASSTWTGAAQYGISNSTATNNVDGYGNVGGEAQKVGWGATVGAGWRTLTSPEWLYLLSTRETGVTVNSTGHARRTHAVINTDGTAVKGLIIFPDGYVGGTPAGVTWGTINEKSDFTTTCTSAGWTALEAAGCVFLPAAGYREASNVTDAGIGGGYWSSSSSYATSAFGLYFESDYMSIQYGGSRKYGFSVRLVKDTE